MMGSGTHGVTLIKLGLYRIKDLEFYLLRHECLQPKTFPVMGEGNSTGDRCGSYQSVLSLQQDRSHLLTNYNSADLR